MFSYALDLRITERQYETQGRESMKICMQSRSMKTYTQGKAEVRGKSTENLIFRTFEAPFF